MFSAQMIATAKMENVSLKQDSASARNQIYMVPFANSHTTVTFKVALTAPLVMKIVGSATVPVPSLEMIAQSCQIVPPTQTV